jgi:hypothetical protein
MQIVNLRDVCILGSLSICICSMSRGTHTHTLNSTKFLGVRKRVHLLSLEHLERRADGDGAGGGCGGGEREGEEEDRRFNF